MPTQGPLKSSLLPDGRRDRVYPADVAGRFTRRRRVVFFLLISIYVLLPWIEIGGHPAVFLNVAEREFYLFGLTFNAQDVWMMFFFTTGLGFSLIVLTTLFGRVWCGYACPQTVFIEGVFRRIERAVEGPRTVRIRRDRKPMHFDKLWRKIVKHTLYVLVAAAVAHIFLSYFVSLPELWRMLMASPAEHPKAFTIVVVLTLLSYGNFAYFREQFCLIVCPYGRLQSVMTDKDTLIVGYDESRGEPRGKLGKGQGDCIDCGRCVAVCPTGIDIRNGLQVDCIGCAACIDACDAIMDKVKRPKGLVRYDSLHGLANQKRRFWRPRVFLYVLLGAIGLTVATVSVSGRKDYEAILLRGKGLPYVVENGEIRNTLELHLVNKADRPRRFTLTGGKAPLRYLIPQETVALEAMDNQRLPIIVIVSDEDARSGLTADIVLREDEGEPRTLQIPFVVPPTKR